MFLFCFGLHLRHMNCPFSSLNLLVYLPITAMATSNVARSSSNNSMATTAQDNDGNLPPTFAETLVTEVFRPGVSPMTFTILNYSLVGLILVLFWLALQGNFNIHVAIVTFLASGLLLVVNWYVSCNMNVDGISLIMVNDALRKGKIIMMRYLYIHVWYCFDLLFFFLT